MQWLVILLLIYGAIASNAETSKLANGLTRFSSDFYQQCTQSTRENVFVSPFSVANALAMLSQAANGKTYDELTHALHLGSDKNATATQFKHHMEMLQKGAGDALLSITTRVYLRKGRMWKKSFRIAASRNYGTTVATLDFANNHGSAQEINKFVAVKTHNRIRELINPDALSKDTRFVLINAIYFKGVWDQQFDKAATRHGQFFINNHDTVPVEYMHLSNFRVQPFPYAYLNDLDASALELKYLNSNFSMIIILPNQRTGLETLEAKLNNIPIESIIDKLETEEVFIEIPKFKVEFEVDLQHILPKMGIRELFGESADLSGIYKREPLYVSSATHKAFIEVDEVGSEAAAATGFVLDMRMGGEPTEFRVNQPFKFLIWDNASKTVVFDGRITTIK